MEGAILMAIIAFFWLLFIPIIAIFHKQESMMKKIEELKNKDT